jgi:hypothetical protein
MEMADDPVFLKVTFAIALVVPTTTFPKATAVVETVVCAAATAVDNRQRIAAKDTTVRF